MALTTQPRSRPMLIRALAAIAVLAGGLVLLLHQRTEGAPPVTFAQGGLSANAWVLPQEQVVAFVAAHGGTMPNFLPNGSQPAAVVRLDWTSQPSLPADAWFNIVVIDPTGQDAATLAQTGPSDAQITLGWDGRFDDLASRYPWLSAAHAVPTGGGSGATLDPMAVEFHPDVAGPLWFVARFPSNTAIGIAHSGDTPIVGAFLTGTDEKIWWAQQLTGATRP